MSTAQDLPLEALAASGVELGLPLVGPPAALRLVPVEPLVPVAPLDFDEAVRTLRPRLHRYAVRRLGDLHEAEELVQEALLRAYSHREKLQTEDDLAAWTTVVTGRLVIDRLRVRGRSMSVADVPEGHRVSRDTADVVVARDEARTALDALDAMPPRQAALLWAREVEGQSYDELCTRFGMTEPAVRSVLTRARKALRKEYAARGGTVPVGGLAVLAPWAAGLSWAHKLRHVATRLTAPAALGAVGITALGGLVLSPFGLLPPAAGSPFTPAEAVVNQLDADPVPHAPVFRTTPPAQRGGVAPRGAEANGSLFDQVAHHARQGVPCVNDTDTGSDHPTVPLPGANGTDPTAGPSSCDTARRTPHATYVLSPTLPDNPTGVSQVSVGFSDASCAPLPGNPIITCTGHHTQHDTQLTTQHGDLS